MQSDDDDEPPRRPAGPDGAADDDDDKGSDTNSNDDEYSSGEEGEESGNEQQQDGKEEEDDDDMLPGGPSIHQRSVRYGIKAQQRLHQKVVQTMTTSRGKRTVEGMLLEVRFHGLARYYWLHCCSHTHCSLSLPLSG